MSAPAPRVTLEGQMLAVSGEVDADSVVALRKEGERLISQAAGPLTVDLSALATAHSAVLSMLLCWQRLASRQSLSMHCRGASARLVSLAALSNLDDQIPGFIAHG
jgi:phospholipid transport system transporter-binding protein